MARPRLALSLAVALAAILPSAARADDTVSVYQPPLDGAAHPEGDPAPAGYHVESRVRKRQVIPGALLFAIPYTFSALGGLSSSEHRVLLVPVAGPVLEMSGVAHAAHNDLGAAVLSPFVVLALAMDTLLQASGAVLLVAGLSSPEHVLVRDAVVTVRAAPMRLGERGHGLGVVGTF